MPGTYIHTQTTTFPFCKEPGSLPILFHIFSFFLAYLRSLLALLPFLRRAKSTRPSLSIITTVAITEGLRFPPYIAATFLF